MASVVSTIKNLVRWGRTSRPSADIESVPIQQMEYLGKAADAVAWFPYGFHASVPPNELGVMLSMQGNTESRVVFPGSPILRPKPLVTGEVVIYHPITQSKIHFKATGDIEITGVTNLTATVAGTTTITSTGNVILTSLGTIAVTATGILSLTGSSIEAALGATLRLMNENIIAIYNNHYHPGGGGNPADVPDTLFVAGTDTTVVLKGS